MSLTGMLLVAALIFLSCGLQRIEAGCPFSRDKRAVVEDDVSEMRRNMSARYIDSIFTMGLDEETRTRSKPSDKNSYGPCRSETCVAQSRYRTFNGFCNNLASNINYGRSTVALKRLLPPDYDDGISQPRQRSSRGRPLPNPRKVSTTLHASLRSEPDTKNTLTLMQWGQFIAHDIALTPMVRVADGSLPDCKPCHSSRTDPVGCNPIPIPEGDPFFPQRDEKTGEQMCIKFVRSRAYSGSKGGAEQINAVTSWMDSSQIYGTFLCHADHLRSKRGGQLKTLTHPLSPATFKPLMPRHATNHECKSPSGLCFNAGDDRTNEQPGLASMHTLLMREHNRVASHLAILNRHWGDERIFQEARKIVIAVNQFVTYNEFLPLVLGDTLMQAYELDLLNTKYNYDNSCDPAITNEFASAAFRFGHSLISDHFKMKARGHRRNKATHTLVSNFTDNALKLRNHINNPDILMSPHFVDELIQGLAAEPMSKYDRGIVAEVLNHLNETDGKSFDGSDLAALNLQRGRDHGLPGYVKYEQYCGQEILNLLRKRLNKTPEPYAGVRDFNDLKTRGFDDETIRQLRKVYDHVEDIDLFTGGLSEPSLDGGLVGKTFGCIIGMQFQKLRQCDRFWFETPDSKLGFTKLQLAEIRKTTMGSLICHNLDSASGIQGSAFLIKNDDTNPALECSKHSKIDFKKWKENLVETERWACDVSGRIILPGKELRVSACTSCQCPLQKGKDPECTTLASKSCKELVNEVGLEAVLVDTSCVNMCDDFLTRLEELPTILI